jgi:uncharacterized protein YbaA (DUF1428 family)
MSYVDGFVVPVRKRDLAAYRRMAKTAGKVWREHGALEFRESIADDVSWGKRTSFPRSVKQKSGETVVFSYIVYKSRADRDRINAKVMKDKRLAKMMQLKALPFDARRMIWGGFKPQLAIGKNESCAPIDPLLRPRADVTEGSPRAAAGVVEQIDRLA